MPRSHGLTHPGRKRANNEDAFVADDTLGIYVVCDGVGGHAKGEVASTEATSQVLSYVREGQSIVDAYLATPSPAHTAELRRLLESAVQNACYMVFGLAEIDPRQRGMATTLSALLLVGGTGFLAQVGDSRIYLLRGGKATQLTEDHTLVNAKLKKGLVTPEQAKTMKGKNVITRAVGHKEYVEVDLIEMPLQEGDCFLLCSDGLHGYLEDGEIEAILAEGSVEDAPQRFIEHANECGGKDNISIVLVVA